MIGLLLSTAFGASACPSVTTNQDLEASLERALTAYLEMREQAFQRGVVEVGGQVRCLGQPIEARLAAGVHHLNGLEAFTHRDLELTRQSFAAVRAADPSFVLSESLAPVGSPLREHFVALRLLKVVPVELASPAMGEIYLDGLATLSRRVQLPGVYQRTDADGMVVDSRLLMPFADTPTYAVRKSPGRRMTGPLLVAGGVVAVASVGFLLAAVQGEADLEGSMLTYEDAQSVQRRINGFSIANVGLGIVAGGLGVSAVVVGRI